MRQHLYQCLEKGYLLPFFIKRRRALKEVVTVYSFDVYCICRMPEMVEGEKWGECTKCLRWYHTDKCLNISQESLKVIGFALTVYLRNISSLSVPCISFLSMHALFNISSISVSCTYLYPCICLSLVCLHALLAHLHSLILAPSLVCLIHSLTNMYGMPFVSKLLFFF